MALPYLQPKKLSSIMVASTKPEGGLKPEADEGDEHPGLMAAADDLISAVHAKDSSGVASAMRAAHEICSSGMDDDDSNLEWPKDQIGGEDE